MKVKTKASGERSDLTALAGKVLFSTTVLSFGLVQVAMQPWSTVTSSHTDGHDFVSGIVAMTTGYRFLPHWGVRISWNRIVTSYSADTDV